MRVASTSRLSSVPRTVISCSSKLYRPTVPLVPSSSVSDSRSRSPSARPTARNSPAPCSNSCRSSSVTSSSSMLPCSSHSASSRKSMRTGWSKVSFRSCSTNSTIRTTRCVPLLRETTTAVSPRQREGARAQDEQHRGHRKRPTRPPRRRRRRQGRRWKRRPGRTQREPRSRRRTRRQRGRRVVRQLDPAAGRSGRTRGLVRHQQHRTGAPLQPNRLAQLSASKRRLRQGGRFSVIGSSVLPRRTATASRAGQMATDWPFVAGRPEGAPLHVEVVHPPVGAVDRRRRWGPPSAAGGRGRPTPRAGCAGRPTRRRGGAGCRSRAQSCAVAYT